MYLCFHFGLLTSGHVGFEGGKIKKMVPGVYNLPGKTRKFYMKSWEKNFDSENFLFCELRPVVKIIAFWMPLGIFSHLIFFLILPRFVSSRLIEP